MTDNMIEAGEAILSSENNYVTYFQLKTHSGYVDYLNSS